MSDWQPIETAPKDGTHLLLYWPDNVQDTVVEGEYYVARDGDEFWWARGRIHSKHSDPTHWMPLPPPPKTEPTT